MTTTSILVVEDERIIAKGIEKRLKGLGYEVTGLASTGEEAIRQATEGRPDLILMDIHLGSGMDGVEAANLIRTRLGTPIVFLTAHSDEATLQRAKVTEPSGFILKPYEDRDIQTAVEIGLYKSMMDRRLRENEQWLEASLSSIGDGVIATDEGGRVRFMNPMAERLTGWIEADALGREVLEIFHIVEEKTHQPVSNPVLGALATGSPANLSQNTILISRAGTEFLLDDIAAPIRDVNGRVEGAVLVFRDVTERRRLEEHLRQAQKMEAIGRLAGGIAHDFNNIMAVVMWFGELLLAGNQRAKQRQELARNILEVGKQGAMLTRQIMAFSRKQILMPFALSLNTVLRDMGPMVKSLVGSGIELVVELAPDLALIKADPSQIGQVVLNLAANAHDAMPKGGRLVVTTANVELDEPASRQHPDVTPGRYVLLSVCDNGSGMSDDVLSHIFEPFFTTKDTGKGTGLGLATVYGIVQQSRGHIDVSSKVGQGTTFRVYLPVVKEAPTKPSSPSIQPATKGHETILIVEDHDTVRNMIVMLLRQHGYTVLEASNGSEGLAVAEDHRGPIHLVITDLVMPKLSGREMADRLTALKPGLRVLFMSGYTEDVVIQQGVESSTVDLLHKPFDITALTQKMREILDRD
ncbi:MAG: response regulator [Nitrospira sp. LK70]|nr:response regulator [Nitrospira sp. LK70]